jgi:cysteine desulfurase
MGSEVYFDNNATTRVLPEVAAAMQHYLTELYGNPSSIHRFGAQVAIRSRLFSRVAALKGITLPSAEWWKRGLISAIL